MTRLLYGLCTALLRHCSGGSSWWCVQRPARFMASVLGCFARDDCCCRTAGHQGERQHSQDDDAPLPTSIMMTPIDSPTRRADQHSGDMGLLRPSG